jgi:L-ascorbate metabolism protein UlaG (beta-lactamase superfamily)
MSASHLQVSARPTRPLPPGAFGAARHTALWWLTNAGFLINSRGMAMLIDPAISMSRADPRLHETGHRLLVSLPIQAAEVPRLDIVLYTHADYDHCAPETAKALVHTGCLFAGPPPVLAELEKLGVARDGLRLVKPGTALGLGDVQIRITPADHPWQLRDPERLGPPFGPEDCCGYLVCTSDGTIWHTGDTRLMEQHLQVCGVDVLLLDVSRCEYHLGPEGGARLANALPGAQVIPHHYGTYSEPDHPAYNGDPSAAAALIRDAARRFHILAPGERYVVSAS